MQAAKRFVWPLVAAIAIAGGSYLGSVELLHSNSAVAAAPARSAQPTPEPRAEAVAPASDLSRAFRTVHNSLQDAVVNINVTKKPEDNGVTVRRRTAIPPQFREQLPDEFRNLIPDMPDQPEAAPEIQGTGSGVIVSADGYILTNNHVVSDATEITVTLNDGRELKAELVGTDPKTDLAVVRVKADHLTFAKFGDSDGLQVGDWVLAFGSPFGFSQTMTQGIISAKGRHIPIIASHDPNLAGLTYENFLQTDAAINPGNSGGPLVNLRGEVVGINAAIASNTGAYNGIGFSIPSNDAQYIMKSLIEHGKVVRGYLGVTIEDINHPSPEDKGLVSSIRRDGFKGEKGVLVREVNVDGPGAQSGLQSGDVITAINGKTVDTVDDLRNQIARTAPNSRISLSIFRGGKDQQISATVGLQPDTNRPTGLARGNDNQPGSADAKDLGITVRDLDPNQANRYGLRDGNGVIITNVAPNGAAAELGLNRGDVITQLDGKPVSSAKDFNDALASAKLSNGVKMRIRTQNGMDRLVYLEQK